MQLLHYSFTRNNAILGLASCLAIINLNIHDDLVDNANQVFLPSSNLLPYFEINLPSLPRTRRISDVDAWGSL